MRDKKLSDVEEAKKLELEDPDKPNNISGDTIFAYKLYLELKERIEALEMKP
jgi:hypothetical protein